MSEQEKPEVKAPNAENRANLAKAIGGFQIGDTIADRYQVVRMLGKGGMGIVYLVNDLKRDRQIALKTLLPQYATNQQAVGRFVREVNAVRQLNHPGIVKILAARQHKSLLYYTMEYLDGKTVREYMVKRGKLGLGSSVRILSLLCDALEHVHAVTVHRDLSPENIILLQDGTIKLLDFGLAKLQDPSGAQFTRVGATLGRIQYNAPEQSFNATEVDQRADIYSIGVIFFEMLSGKVPRTFESITELCPELPKETNRFLERALARDPKERIANAAEFREGLNTLYQISIGKAEGEGEGQAEESGGGFLASIIEKLTGLFRKK
jgi:eukaryotic-like serine/threonine-protein kinase